MVVFSSVSDVISPVSTLYSGVGGVECVINVAETSEVLPASSMARITIGYSVSLLNSVS